MLREGALSFRIHVLPAAALAASLATAVTAVAEPTPLRGEALRAIVPGAHIELDTPLRTVVPIRFTADGLMTGEANGLAPYLGSERDRGRWHVTGDQLCLKWFRWFESEERCLNLQRQDQRIFWQDAGGESGTATLVTSGEDAAKAARFAYATAGVASGQATAPAAATKSTAAPAEKAPSPPAAVTPVQVAAAPALIATANAAAPAATPTASANLANLTIISRAEAATPPPSRPAAEPSPKPAAMTPAKAPPAVATKAKATRAEKGPAVAKVAAKHKTRVSSAAPINGPAYQVAHVEDDDVLNIRNGPSEDHETIGEIPPNGRGVRIVGPCKIDWCPIAHGDAKGWVNRYYLMAEPAANAPAGNTVARRIR